MTDKERREDDALKNLIQAAYDFSDEQLLAELEETEATLSDSDFPGIEDRAYQKLMARLAEEEAEEVEAPVAAPVATPVAVPTPAEEKGKVVRFGKKKAVVVGLLAAAFVGMLGVTAIGGKNYFFRDREILVGKIFDNDNNVDNIGDLEDAYFEIENLFGTKVLKLEYIPEGMSFKELKLIEDTAIIVLDYNGKLFYFIQEQKNKETSIGINSDRKETEQKVYNNWLKKEIYLEEEIFENKQKAYSFSLNIDNLRCQCFGQISSEEMKKIACYLNF